MSAHGLMLAALIMAVVLWVVTTVAWLRRSEECSELRTRVMNLEGILAVRDRQWVKAQRRADRLAELLQASMHVLRGEKKAGGQR